MQWIARISELNARAHAALKPAIEAIDGARAAELTLAGAPARLVAAEGFAALQAGVDVAIAAQCAEGVGAMDRLLAITVDYMNTRKQFGVAIASLRLLVSAPAARSPGERARITVSRSGLAPAIVARTSGEIADAPATTPAPTAATTRKVTPLFSFMRSSLPVDPTRLGKVYVL